MNADISDFPDPVASLVHAFRLSPHPEGGFFREVYSGPSGLALFSDKKRSLCSHILFLLTRRGRSRFHRIDADELWHHYEGASVTIIELRKGAVTKVTQLGKADEESLTHVVPAGTWFGAFVQLEHEYALVGCTVSPAFEYSKFELGSRDALKCMFPDADGYIDLLCD